ncbi:hypothetical protein EV193_110177 [Herbihabitans rhizosphaerae]|uniref:Secreted protein n=1 Tax=Herbihabitans rhizosphaerae TaxID=1872711 RepID=A0A4V2ERT9_9PSEU|nr:hypothetical protein [Herbihabitans rhizosphaerae]RZS34027.1 hypothetical protein EV193_110177 [Herbihabitans rhizosphaerae]
MSTRHRFASALMVTGLLTAGLFTVASTASPGTAQARCDGRNQIRSDYWTGGVRRAYEDPVGGTCDGNNYYQGDLVDPVRDGACVEVQFLDGSVPWTRAADGRSCVTGARQRFWHRDVNGTSAAWERFCADQYGCGWGRNGESQGLNHGY